MENIKDYKKLIPLLDKVQAEVTAALIECSKDHPNDVLVCDHAVENLRNLLDLIEDAFFAN